MFVAYKNSDKKVLAIRGTEWQCRMTAKSIDVVAYNAWVDSITDSDGVITCLLYTSPSPRDRG